ncbi:ATP-dependent DNA helicase [Alginatibacterium sediminis]|uniref:ATP-dependent DNA helicase YoaA n=1 Tax=Alginatibacterium sediminis TaxID=2164068 RepID=A0A420EFY8_9ALTE|nr:ATP-dependent DNA helicase [Alginatibacterium sediminis]RKF19573.1 ATP-dependent DNA helicase [Alginatibacterium sediminis]
MPVSSTPNSTSFESSQQESQSSLKASAAYFESKGTLAQRIDGFAPRSQQQDMASAVEQCIESQATLLVEAGTGTGKTFAYLLPALLSGKKVVISTGSKALQDQLFQKDLPTVQAAIDYAMPVALLKGRSNYLCIERVNSFAHRSGGQSPQVLAELVKIKAWSAGNRSGDISELGPIAERADIFPLITSTNDNCLGRECANYDDCYLVKARSRAMEAQLVVVNHHLFMADMVVKESGFGELIPEAEVYLFDEAHQLPDIAIQYFGQSLSSRQILDLCNDVELAYRTELYDMAQLAKAAKKLSLSVRDFRVAFEGERDRGDLRPLFKRPKFAQQLPSIREDMGFLQSVLKLALSRCELGDSCYERLCKFISLFDKIVQVNASGNSYWYETTRIHFTLHLTPLNVSERFDQELEQRKAAWIFTSATLAVNGGFEHFQNQLGLASATTLLLDSPFDYAQQSMFCVPRYLPQLRDPKIDQKLADMLLPVIEANQGRCFFLCTSHSMTQKMAAVLREKSNFTILVQGEAAKGELLESFIEDGNAILVATSSFWEGVDVRGQALSCVIIDKLPFSAPDDPMLVAKSEDCKMRGGDPFAQVYLPEAAIALKQGVGRLIRDHTDRGVVIVCDPRMVHRDYGELFVASLPPMKRTRDLQQLIKFIHESD